MSLFSSLGKLISNPLVRSVASVVAPAAAPWMAAIGAIQGAAASPSAPAGYFPTLESASYAPTLPPRPTAIAGGGYVNWSPLLAAYPHLQRDPMFDPNPESGWTLSYRGSDAEGYYDDYGYWCGP